MVFENDFMRFCEGLFLLFFGLTWRCNWNTLLGDSAYIALAD
jgi:hypothetical protein